MGMLFLAGILYAQMFPEGMYELVISNGNKFDETSTQILGSINTITLELHIKQGSGSKKGKKEKNSPRFLS